MKKFIVVAMLLTVANVAWAVEYDVDETVIPAVEEKVEYKMPGKDITIYLNEGESLSGSPIIQEWASKVVPEDKSFTMSIYVRTKVSDDQMEPKPADTIADRKLSIRDIARGLR